MIGLCTDSNSQITPELARRYDVEVVPLTVTIDGEALLEGVDIDADRFWARLAAGISTVTTSAPSPGQFLAAYEALARRGVTEVLSVHVSAEVSSTIEAARVGARAAPVEVRVVDSGTASFGVSCAVWEAAEALAAGAETEQAAEVASRVGAGTQNVFVMGTVDLARLGGRLDRKAPSGTGVGLFSMIGGIMTVLDHPSGPEPAAESMAARICAPGSPPMRVAIGVGDRGSEPLAAALEERLRSAAGVADLVRYRIGPSVGAHTGPGTVGAYYWPTRT